MQRPGADVERARDSMLAGSVAQITDTLRRLEAAGVGMPFIPSMCLPEDARTLLERFTAEGMPAFR